MWRDSTPVSNIVISDLAYAPPGADQLFFDLSFTVSPGEHAAIVGPNGVGKSTILRILSGELEADDGELVESWGRWYLAGREARWARRNALVVLGNPAAGEPADVHNLVILSRWPITARRQVFHDFVPVEAWTPPWPGEPL